MVPVFNLGAAVTLILLGQAAWEGQYARNGVNAVEADARTLGGLAYLGAAAAIVFGIVVIVKMRRDERP